MWFSGGSQALQSLLVFAAAAQAIPSALEARRHLGSALGLQKRAAVSPRAPELVLVGAGSCDNAQKDEAIETSCQNARLVPPKLTNHDLLVTPHNPVAITYGTAGHSEAYDKLMISLGSGSEQKIKHQMKEWKSVLAEVTPELTGLETTVFALDLRTSRLPLETRKEVYDRQTRLTMYMTTEGGKLTLRLLPSDYAGRGKVAMDEKQKLKVTGALGQDYTDTLPAVNWDDYFREIQIQLYGRTPS